MTRTSLFPRQQNSNTVHDCFKGGLLSFHSFEETHNLMGKMPEIIRQNSTINPNGSLNTCCKNFPPEILKIKSKPR